MNPASVSKPASRGKVRPLHRLQIADVDRAFEHQNRFVFDPGSLGETSNSSSYISHKLLEDVFDRNHARGRSELVDDNGQVSPPLFELRQQLGEYLRLGNHDHIVP